MARILDWAPRAVAGGTTHIPPARPGGGGVIRALADEVRVARVEIRQGRFERVMALLTAFSAIVSGLEAYSQHLRGAFRDWLMWTPVALTPVAVVAGIGALFDEWLARRALPIVSIASIVDGVVGFIFHVRGIQRLPGGFRLGQYNVVIGPPIFAPLLTCTVGIVGLLASYLRRGQLVPAPRSTLPRWSPRLGAAGPLDVVRSAADSVEVVSRQLTPGSASPLEGLESDIAHGRFQQPLALTAALLGVLAGGEAYFEHLRGSFNQRVMWTPVWVTPPMVAAGIAAAVSPKAARAVLPWASTATFLDGVLGFLLHLRGLRRMPGGFGNLGFNAVMGPPIFAPLLFCSVGLLGMTASILRRARG